MANTTAEDIIQSFESSFADKQVLPKSLEVEWLERAIGKYSLKLDKLNYDPNLEEFDCELDRYVVDTLAAFMKQFYQERQVSLVNKRVSITGKDLSIDGSNGTKTSEKSHLEYVEGIVNEMVSDQMPTAYN